MHIPRRPPNFHCIDHYTSEKISTSSTIIVGVGITESCHNRPESKGRNTLEAIAERSALEEVPIPRSQLIQLVSPLKLNSAIHKQIESVTPLAEETVVSIFDDADGAMKSISNTEEASVNRAVVKRSVFMAPKSASLQTAKYQVGFECMTESHVFDSFATCTIDDLAFSASPSRSLSTWSSIGLLKKSRGKKEPLN